jgi:hypothetical protein
LSGPAVTFASAAMELKNACAASSGLMCLAGAPMIAGWSFWCLCVPPPPMFVFRVRTLLAGCRSAIPVASCQFVRPTYYTKRPSPPHWRFLTTHLHYFLLHFFILGSPLTLFDPFLDNFLLPPLVTSSTSRYLVNDDRLVDSPSTCHNQCRSIPYTARPSFERLFQAFSFIGLSAVLLLFNPPYSCRLPYQSKR